MARWQPPHAARTITHPRCCWPDCYRFATNDFPLCKAHIIVTHDYHLADNPVTRYQWNPNQPTTEEAPATEKLGTIYFIRSGGYIKIGWTSNLKNRMRGYLPDTTLLAVKPGTRRDENRIHKRFAHLTTHGREWFPLAPQITEYIAQVVREHGEPPHVDFSAKPKTPNQGPRLNRWVGGDNRGPLHARQRP